MPDIGGEMLASRFNMESLLAIQNLVSEQLLTHLEDITLTSCSFNLFLLFFSFQNWLCLTMRAQIKE